MKNKILGILVALTAFSLISTIVFAFHPQSAPAGETPRGPDSQASDNIPCTHPGLPVAIAKGGNVHCFEVHTA